MAFDIIVIGSGFGGAITGCRLAEGGYNVLILERGRRWDKTNYPRKPEDMWIWNHEKPEKENGWLDLHVFPHMSVAQGAAVGGGSQIYANISCDAPAAAFDQGWPAEITYSELKPYADVVAKFMNVQEVPDNQWTRRMALMKEGAEKISHGDRFKKLELAVSFDPRWNYGLDDAHNPARSKQFVNAQGIEQGTCVHLGNCDIGCDVDARNTLDRNYIPWAEKYGAEVRELHLVNNIEPVDNGYRVYFDRLADGGRIPGSETARIVIVAASSLGSTELLLRCRDVSATLPNLSPVLGHGWSSNGDFMTPAVYGDREVDPTTGPTIACAIDFLDRSESNESFWIEDGGFLGLINNYVRALQSRPSGVQGAMAKGLLDRFNQFLREHDALRHVMPWFAQGVDAADGVLSLQPAPATGESRLSLAWDIGKSRGVFDAIVQMHRELSVATGGKPLVSPTWSVFHDLVTPHPLGGCGIGNSPAAGVVNHAGEVFGYQNLYVVDASIIPRALGVNPSRTIGALAERIAKIIKDEAR
ncbi:MAG: GMC oxidoreductase [Pseudonocardiaceae bacterium]